MKLARFLLPTFLPGFALAALAADTSSQVALPQTPPAVQKAIATRIADGALEEIDQSIEDGETLFDVSFITKAGAEQGFTLADDGTLLSVEVELAATPPAVQKAISAEAPGWNLEGIDQSMDDTEVSYDVDISKDGRERTFTVADDGDLLSAQVDLVFTPAPVQAAIKAQVAGGALQSVDEDFDPAGNTFDVEAISKTGTPQSFTVDQNGTVISVEVTLAQVPPPAAKTIRAQIGDGKILRIDKSLTEKEGKVLPYDVEGRKDGKEFDFSVGPKGRFLGMDD
jgi:uncharacterized membrane protein YkoI